MLPVATPPNAIVFSAAHMNPVDMVSIIFISSIYRIHIYLLIQVLLNLLDESRFLDEHNLCYGDLHIHIHLWRFLIQFQRVPKLGA